MLTFAAKFNSFLTHLLLYFRGFERLQKKTLASKLLRNIALLWAPRTPLHSKLDRPVDMLQLLSYDWTIAVQGVGGLAKGQWLLKNGLPMGMCLEFVFKFIHNIHTVQTYIVYRMWQYTIMKTYCGNTGWYNMWIKVCTRIPSCQIVVLLLMLIPMKITKINKAIFIFCHFCKMCFTMLHIQGYDHAEIITPFAHGSFYICLFAFGGLTFFLVHISISLNNSCLTRMWEAMQHTL